jgi:predicted metal-dependent hydrolase
MSAFQLKEAPDVTVELRRSARARRLSLRVSSLDGRVTLTVPKGTPERVARAFAEEKARWLQDAVGRVALPVPVVIGAELPVEGRPHRIVAGAGRAARLGPGTIEAPPGREGPVIETLCKQIARNRLDTAVAGYASDLGRPYGRITLRDTRSRWGSCSSAGNLMFSWRLALAPAPVLRYVAAHEVAHLAHMDHSAAFWATCRALCPETDDHRGWLRTHGSRLHSYQFRTPD